MEDLKASDFEMIHHADPNTADHVKLVMQGLGKLHAISFAMKDQEPKKFKELASNIKEILIQIEDKQMQEFWDSWPPGVLAALNDPKDAHIKQKAEKLYARRHIETAWECVDGKDAEPYSVICHGMSN